MHSMHAMPAAAAAACLAANAAAQTPTVCWYWEVMDTAGNVGFVVPGAQAYLTLWAAFDPPNHGFAQAGPYTISGNAEWQAGTVFGHDNRLWFTSGHGDLNPDESITGVENFQLPELFNTDYIADNPILLYSIWWAPDRYEGQWVTVSNGAPDAFIYTNAFGSSVLYQGSCAGTITFQVVPTPGCLTLLALGGLAGTLRRRKAMPAATP